MISKQFIHRRFLCARHYILFSYVDEAGEWGTIADNMTGDGVLGAIVERRADIGISALYSWYFSSAFFNNSIEGVILFFV